MVMTAPNRIVNTESRSYTIPHPVIDPSAETTRSHRVRIGLDYIDSWDEMTPTQRGELIAFALESQREEGWSTCG